MELTGKKVWFLGDSITAGAGTSCEEARFSEVLKKNALQCYFSCPAGFFYPIWTLMLCMII